MDLSEAASTFGAAVSELAEGPGAIQQRLNRAAAVGLADLDPGGLPDDIRTRVEAVVAQLGVTPITRTMMTDDAAGAVAKEIVAIAFDLCRRAAGPA